MKQLMIFAFAVLIAAPGHAENLLNLRAQSTKMLDDLLSVAKSKNWRLACSKYKEYLNFETKHGLMSSGRSLEILRKTSNH